jgi:hypothetical protein
MYLILKTSRGASDPFPVPAVKNAASVITNQACSKFGTGGDVRKMGRMAPPADLKLFRHNNRQA